MASALACCVPPTVTQRVKGGTEAGSFLWKNYWWQSCQDELCPAAKLTWVGGLLYTVIPYD